MAQQPAPPPPDSTLRLTRASHQSLVSQVAKHLIDAIRTGQVEAGARLVESDIARQMGISRGPVREAMQQLAEAGLVDKMPHRGWFVCHPSRKELADMLLMRATLESLAAWLVASRRDERDLDALRTIVTAMEEATAEQDAMHLSDLNWRFHETVCHASHNDLLVKCWYMLRNGLRLVMSPSNAGSSDYQQALEHHRALLDALMTAPPEAAAAIFRERALVSASRWMAQDVLDIVVGD